MWKQRPLGGVWRGRRAKIDRTGRSTAFGLEKISEPGIILSEVDAIDGCQCWTGKIGRARAFEPVEQARELEALLGVHIHVEISPERSGSVTLWKCCPLEREN